MLSVAQALALSFVMGAVIFLCRAFPFLFFREKKGDGKGGSGKASAAFLALVEKTAPPVAMTVLAFNAMGGPIKDAIRAAAPLGNTAIPVLAASVFTAVTHLWKRNALISIIGGTAAYMVLSRALG
jgi:branched-subunit amino acid transport protein AzlD